MKYLIGFLTLATLGSIILGFTIESIYAQKLVGFGVVGLVVVVFPMFSYYRWKNKNLKDYMITKENLEKMRNYKNEKATKY